jgi:multimeric flavodoxin WrbA
MKTVIAFNGGPRKKMNTASLLQRALDGAASVGAKTRLVHLYSLRYKGCISCYQCKTLKGESLGKCAVKDDLRPILESVEQADAALFGSPIYFGNITGEMRSFLERLLYPYHSYSEDRTSLFKKRIRTGFIYTMGVTEERMKKLHYEQNLQGMESFIAHDLGDIRTLTVCDTLHTDDYSIMDASAFDIETKRKRHEEIFPLELQKAFELGKSLVA